MKLKVYLAERNLSVKDFADKISYSRTYLHALMNKKRNPGKRFLKALELGTNGLVTFEDILSYADKTKKMSD